MKRTLTGILILTLAGCATNPEPYVGAVMSPPAREALYVPEKAQPGRLEYAPDRDTFAPVLTERFTFPTQQQANNAWLRARVPPGPYDIINASEECSTPESPGTNVSRISIFACKPGAFDEQTTRIARSRAPVVHCATDFINEAGQRLRGLVSRHEIRPQHMIRAAHVIGPTHAVRRAVTEFAYDLDKGAFVARFAVHNYTIHVEDDGGEVVVRFLWRQVRSPG